MAHDYPAFMADCFVSNDEAMKRVVRSYTRLAAGFATSEPHTFYEQLWDFIVANDLHDISLRQALFMAPYKLCVGEAMSSKGLFAEQAKGRGLSGVLAKKSTPRPASSKAYESSSRTLKSYAPEKSSSFRRF